MNVISPILLAVGLALMEPVGAQHTSEPVAFAIPTKPLSNALAQWSQVTGLQVISQDGVLRDLTANPVLGSYTPMEALRLLLSNTQLTFTAVGENTVSIEPMKRNVTPNNVGSPLQRLAAAQPAAASTARPLYGSTAATQAGTTEGQVREEIIVTAQKREERLQDVPISMSVLSGDVMDKSTAEGATEILSRVPGVSSSLAVQGGGTQMAVRGVTANSPLNNGSSPVAYYLDSVPFGLVRTAIAPDPNVYDLERIEVLRGPQGTLYGASAQNGVVRVLTRDPDFQEFQLKARTSLSTTEDGGEGYRGDVAMNLPLISGKLGARVVAGYQDLDGWIDTPAQEDVNDATLRNLRVKVGAQPADNLSIGLSAWLSRSDYGAPSASDDDLRRSSVADESIETDYDVLGLRVGYDLAAFSIASTTSYLEYSNGAGLDLLPYVGVPAVLFTGHDVEVLSQEVILTSTPGDSWRWSFGGMHRDAEARLIQTLPFFVVPVDYTDKSESVAVFGEITRLLMDGKFEITGGLRYFEDDVTQFENVPQSGVLTDPLIRSAGTFDKVSPRIVFTWHPNDALTLYTSYSEGFRSGFNQDARIIRAAPRFPPLKPDNLKNYELGAKGNLFDGRMSYDTAVFFIDWQDVQQAVSVNIDNVPFSAMVNTGSASGVGFEFAVTAQPIEDFDVAVNFSWNDLTADETVQSAGGILFDRGDRLNYSSEYTAGVSASYSMSLGASGYTGQISTAASYSSEQVYRSAVDGVRGIDVGGALLIGRLSFALESPHHWSATLFVDNINNESDPGVGLFAVPDWRQRVRPRSIGAQLEYRF